MLVSVQAVKTIQVGAVMALVAVCMGAFGAHALKKSLDAYALSVYQTAVTYQMYHALALVSVGVLFIACKGERAQRWLVLSRNTFVFGIVFFCGSLYLLSFSGLTFLGAITPLGGVAFILGWLALIIALKVQLADQSAAA